MAMRSDKTKKEQENACGANFIRAADSSPMLKTFAEHSGMLQIAYDCFLEWHEAQSPEQKTQAWRLYRREMRNILVAHIFFDLSVALPIHFLFVDIRYSIVLVVCLYFAVMTLIK